VVDLLVEVLMLMLLVPEPVWIQNFHPLAVDLQGLPTQQVQWTTVVSPTGCLWVVLQLMLVEETDLDPAWCKVLAALVVMWSELCMLVEDRHPQVRKQEADPPVSHYPCFHGVKHEENCE
jgi:hypothetical protein